MSAKRACVFCSVSSNEEDKEAESVITRLSCARGVAASSSVNCYSEMAVLRSSLNAAAGDLAAAPCADEDDMNGF